MTSENLAAVAAGPAEALRIAGARRRLAAFVVDILVLMLIGLTLGRYFGEAFFGLGAWGRLLGFGIAAAYFGVFDSGFGKGTLGKRVLALRVVGRDGTGLSVPRALLRFVPVGVPYFVNGAPLPPALTDSPVFAALPSLAVFGLGGATLWLLVFDAARRQGLHDLLAGSYVVHARGSALRAPWRGHGLICGLIFAAAAAAPWCAQDLARGETFALLVETQRALARQPWVRTASVRRGTMGVLNFGGATRLRVLTVEAVVVDRDIDAPARFEQAAALALITQADDIDALSVTLRAGYDIGIASRWRSNTETRSVAEWRLRVGSSGQRI